MNFLNNRKEYQLKKLQQLERKELLSPYKISPERLEIRAKAWASLADKAKRECVAN